MQNEESERNFIDKKLLKYLLKKLEFDIWLLADRTGIKYMKIWLSVNSTRRLKDEELVILSEYVKKNTSLTDHYINKRFNKLYARNRRSPKTR